MYAIRSYYALEMYEITAGENTVYQIPSLNFRGTPTGIDVIKVVEKNILQIFQCRNVSQILKLSGQIRNNFV